MIGDTGEEIRFFIHAWSKKGQEKKCNILNHIEQHTSSVTSLLRNAMEDWASALHRAPCTRGFLWAGCVRNLVSVLSARRGTICLCVISFFSLPFSPVRQQAKEGREGACWSVGGEGEGFVGGGGRMEGEEAG